jgi:hypothetical protein
MLRVERTGQKWDLRKNGQNMKLIRSIKFSFENPRWWFASLVVMLASYVPILGHIVLLGYFSTILGKFITTKNDSYEDFDFGMLVDYFRVN